MSLDFYLQTEVCPHCQNGGYEVFWRNITHNVIPMWSKAGVYDILYMFEGQKASQHIQTLKAGYAHMCQNPSEYILLEPENKWGSYEGAKSFLRAAIEAFEKFPSAVIHISK